MKRLLAFLALCIPIYILAQGFGSFTHDQPYFAKDRGSQSAGPLPEGSMYLWINPVASNVFKSQYVTNPVTAANGDRIGAVVDISTNAYTFTNNINDAQNIIRWYTNRHGNTNPVIFVNASVGNAILHCNQIIVTNYPIISSWIFVAYYADTSTGYNFFPNYPWSSYINAGNIPYRCILRTGSGSTQITGGSGSGTTFGYKNDAWQLLSVYTHMESGNSIVVVRTNGVVSVASTNVTGTIHIKGLTLGGLADGSSSSGDIAEFIGFGREMTSNEVYQVENYLRRHPVEYFGP